MSSNMSTVDVKELMYEAYCGVMAWLTRVGGVGSIAQNIQSYGLHQ